MSAQLRVLGWLGYAQTITQARCKLRERATASGATTRYPDTSRRGQKYDTRRKTEWLSKGERMARLSWPKAKARGQMEKASKAEANALYLSGKPWIGYNHKAFLAHKRTEKIKHLNRRIANGKEWIATIPSNDPRWPRWQRALAVLIHHRKALMGEGGR